MQRLERDGAASFDTLMEVADAFGIDVRELNEFPKIQKKDMSQKKVHHYRMLKKKLKNGEKTKIAIAHTALLETDLLRNFYWGSQNFRMRSSYTYPWTKTGGRS